MIKSIKTGAATFLLLTLLTACGQTPTSVTPSGTTNSGDVKSTVNVPSLGALNFTKVSDDKAVQYNSMINQNESVSQSASGGATAPMAAPTVAARGDVAAVDSKAAASLMYFPSPGAFEEYTVTDFSEASIAGFSGTYIETLNKVVKPIVLALGSDARLVNSNGSTDANGVNIANPTDSNTNNQAYPNYYNQYQWQFTYSSASLKQVYSIFVSNKETLVLKQQWGLKDLNTDNLKIDSKDAISIMTKAILDKNYVSPDAQQNQPYGYPTGYEVLNEIPANSNWYLYLEQEKGNLIWSISLNVNYNVVYPPIAYAADASVGSATSGGGSDAKPSTTPAVPEYWYSGGYARIDAVTGNILSLTKPSRYKNVQPEPYPATGAVNGSSGSGTASANATTTEATPPCCKN